MTNPLLVDINNGLNASFGLIALFVWAATIWIYFKGDWRQHPDARARKNAAMFIRGVCLLTLAVWTSRAFWFFVIAHKIAPYHWAPVTNMYPVTIIAKIAGIIGAVMMAYPLHARYFGTHWWFTAFIIAAGFFAIGIVIT